MLNILIFLTYYIVGGILSFMTPIVIANVGYYFSHLPYTHPTIVITIVLFTVWYCLGVIMYWYLAESLGNWCDERDKLKKEKQNDNNSKTQKVKK